MECITLAQAEPYIVGLAAGFILARLSVGSFWNLTRPSNKTLKKENNDA